jgi:hypothetical protein
MSYYVQTRLPISNNKEHQGAHPLWLLKGTSKKSLILDNSRVTIHDVANQLKINHGSTYQIFYHRFDFHKNCSRWIIKQSTKRHWQARWISVTAFWISITRKVTPFWVALSLVTKLVCTKASQKANVRKWNPNTQSSHIKNNLKSQSQLGILQ